MAALPIERYRVEQFLIAEPADIDGDCIDDITELADPIRMNPINPAPGIELSDGAMAVPDRPTFEALSYQKEGSPQGLEYVKFVLLGMNTDRPRAYFLNGDTHRYHQTFRDALGLAESGLGMVSGTIVYHPNMIARDGSPADYHYEFWPLTTYPFNTVARSHTVLAANMPLLDDNLVYYMPPVAIPASRREFARYEDSRISLVFDEDIAPESGFISLNPAAGYGFLRVMEPGERPDPRDVVIYAALPNELSRVAGIITTVPQTPLSHVNLRAVQDGVPNAYIRGALDVDEIADLIGDLRPLHGRCERILHPRSDPRRSRSTLRSCSAGQRADPAAQPRGHLDHPAQTDRLRGLDRVRRQSGKRGRAGDVRFFARDHPQRVRRTVLFL